MRSAAFEQRYRDDPDPWRYRTSAYERAKYDATLDACGAGPFTAALELGGSIGVFSAHLAPRCRALTTIDFAPTAVRMARQELAPYPQAQAIVGEIPAAIPDRRFDLVLASEVLYYLDARSLTRAFEALERRLVAGGRLVAVHWLTPGPERPLPAERVHELIRGRPWLRLLRDSSNADYLLDVLERA